MGHRRTSRRFWGIFVALPVGKFVGITLGALIASRFRPAAQRRASVLFGYVAVVPTLGGIAFTVPLLMNELAFRGMAVIISEGTLAVLLGSVAAALIGAAVTATRARQYRARGALEPATD